MNNEKYESPEIQVISIEPDEALMGEEGYGTGTPTLSMGSCVMPCPDENG